MKRKIIVVVLILLHIPIVVYFVFPGLLYDLAINLERKSADLVKKSLEVDHHTIFYLEGGVGEPIVLLHGFTADKDNWTRFAKSLTPMYHVVAIDLPGFGESSKIGTESYSIAAQVKRIDTIISRLKLDKFHLAGNSMGGTIAGKYTVTAPDRVLSLALLNTGGIYSCEKSEFARLAERGENPLLIQTPQDYDSMLQFVFVDPPFIPRPIKKYLTTQSILHKTFYEKILEDLIEEKYSLEPELIKIQVKTLVLWGDTDRLIHVSCTKALEKGLKTSTTVIMKNCGHLPMLERPEETAKHYVEFLKKIYQSK